MTVVEFFSGEDDRLGSALGVAQQTCLFPCLYICQLTARRFMKAREIENNLLLSSPGSCLLAAVAPQVLHQRQKYLWGHLVSLDLILAYACVLILTAVDVRDIV